MDFFYGSVLVKVIWFIWEYKRYKNKFIGLFKKKKLVMMLGNYKKNWLKYKLLYSILYCFGLDIIVLFLCFWVLL